jgi:hypothetical protein
VVSEGGRRAPGFARWRMPTLWRKDGKELFYLDPDGKFFSVDFAHAPESKPVAPRQLFQSRVVVNDMIAQYAVTGDGNRFLPLEPLRARKASHPTNPCCC